MDRLRRTPLREPVTDGHLCARHHQVAVRRWDARTAVEAVRSERYATDRAILAPAKRARLADVEADLAGSLQARIAREDDLR